MYLDLIPENNKGYVGVYVSKCRVFGIDHDTVCAVVVGTAIRHRTSCAGRRTDACGRRRHNVTIGMWRHNQQAANQK